MNAAGFPLPLSPDTSGADAIFQADYQRLACRTDRQLMWLILFQWAAGIAAAIWISPLSWEGLGAHPNPDRFGATVVGGVFVSLAVCLARWRPGRESTRQALALSQMVISALFVHLSGGRLETHFHELGSLALLSFYRDWKVLATASAATAADHFARGALWPESIYGVLAAPTWRAFEHVGWIIFEDIFLLISIAQSVREMHKMAQRQAALEGANARVERTVARRTAELSLAIANSEQARDALRLLASAVEQSNDSIIITDANLDRPGPRIVFANSAYTRLTGYTREEALGNSPRILQGPRTDRAVLDRMRKCLEQGEQFQGETVNYHKDGTEFDLEWQVTPVRNPAHAITHFVAIQRDISERKRLEAEIAQSTKLETVGKLAGGVAHEFNTIMGAIIGQSEMLLADLPPDPCLRKGATAIRTAAERAAVLTRQLLAYGRKQMLRPEILALDAVLSGMTGALRNLLGRNIEVRVLTGAGRHTVKADAAQIEQVVINLAMNAIDAMPNGGRLTLETANETLSPEDVGGAADLPAGEYVCLTVSDTGGGMTNRVKAHLFEPFFTTKEVGRGTGLGLSTCYGIIKQSGGHIRVDSELGEGAIFKIYLPRVDRPARKEAPAPPSALTRGREMILLVESDPVLRESTAAVLKRSGYGVQTAGDAREALRAAAQMPVIDLLMTESVMPELSGAELCARLRAERPTVKALFIVGRASGAGAWNQIGYLQKPYNPALLLRRTREVLGGGAMIEETNVQPASV